MILDRLENAGLYHSLETTFKLALDYLCRTDFSKVLNGRYALDGNNVFAIVQRYPTKPLDEAIWETHRTYTDVQYMVEGSERMGYAPFREDSTVTKAYDSDKDVVFFDTQGDLISVSQGQFAIFMPHDIHAPGLVADGSETPQNVCKVVVKCRVPENYWTVRK